MAMSCCHGATAVKPNLCICGCLHLHIPLPVNMRLYLHTSAPYQILSMCIFRQERTEAIREQEETEEFLAKQTKKLLETEARMEVATQAAQAEASSLHAQLSQAQAQLRHVKEVSLVLNLLSVICTATLPVHHALQTSDSSQHPAPDLATCCKHTCTQPMTAAICRS